MKKARHTEEPITAVLQEAQAGANIEDLCLGPDRRASQDDFSNE